jgi:PEP-CTERM/exosortase A-associated glycosyltransferase
VIASRGFGTSTGCVLHVLDHSWPVLSGYSVRSRNLLTAQHRLGQSLMAVSSPLHELDDGSSSDVTIDGVSYIRTPITGAPARLALPRRWPLVREWETVRLLRNRILQLIDSHPVSIIYAHSPALCGLAGLQAAHRRSLPFVYEVRAFWEDAAVDQKRTTVSSLRYRLTRGLEGYVADWADAVSAIAQPMLDDLCQRGLPAEKLFHVPNGVDADQFAPLPYEQQLAKKLGLEDSVVFGFFGSLYRYEGVAWLIRAASELRSRGHRFKVLIIGNGEEEMAIRDAIHEYNAGEFVLILPRVSHDEIRNYYSIVDVMVFPRLSVRLTELVTPLKPLEAMSLQKAVLASDVGGHRALLEHDNTALLFRAEDVGDFCHQAERLITSPVLRKQLGECGRQVILRDWDWKVVAQRYQRIYEFALLHHDKKKPSLRSRRLVLAAARRRPS